MRGGSTGQPSLAGARRGHAVAGALRCALKGKVDRDWEKNEAAMLTHHLPSAWALHPGPPERELLTRQQDPFSRGPVS